MPVNILLVEDEPAIQQMVAMSLRKAGYEVALTGDSLEAQDHIAGHLPDLILMDWMLPGMSGVEYARQLKKNDLTREIPIIMLTARSEESDKIRGFDSGADDYVTKPFSIRELQARVKAQLRRVQEPSTSTASDARPRYLESGDIKIDLDKHEVFHRGENIELNPKEFELLVLLVSNKDKVVSREQILRKVWGYDYIGNARTVDVHVRWLRQKLEKDADHPQHLQTVRGYGYKFGI